jgi:hypothetical protein
VSGAIVVLIGGLGIPAILPAIAMAGWSPALVFLAPLLGAGMAAVGAELEFGVGGTLITWYVVVAAAVNVAAVVAMARRPPPGLLPQAGRPWMWSALTVVVVLGALAVPLSGLRAGIIGYDGNAIWLTHTLMVSGGHHELLTGLRNPAYAFSNPDYPPLVPAAGALAFRLVGQGDLRVAVEVTALLTACALGVAGAGVAAVASQGRLLARVAVLVAAAAVCMVGFAVTETYYAVGGYADLLWSAAAVAAVVWGLVVPRSAQALAIAWACAAVASLSKNEGLTTALVVLALIAVRYRPLALSRLRRLAGRPAGGDRPGAAGWLVARGWAERAAFVVGPALPGLAWAGLARLIGLRDAFFVASSTQSPLARAHATILGVAPHLIVLPVAAAVLAAGYLLVRRDRERARLAQPAWLWAACLLYLAIIVATYVLGSPEIGWWLRTSVGRTTIFPQLLLYTDLAIWMVIACQGLAPPDAAGRARETAV